MADDVWSGVDLLELDGRQLEATVAFSERVDLAAFLERLSTYQRASPTEKGFLVGADLFDRIERVRFYGPADRISQRLASAVALSEADHVVNVDVEIWHPGDADAADEALRWTGIVRAAVEQADGQVLDWYTNHDVGVQLLRVQLRAAAVTELAEIDEVASLDLKPVPPAGLEGVDDLTAADLPAIAAPPADAPLFAVVDSGVSGSHPLVGPALYEAVTLLPELTDGADEHGHGTAVAGLALHGATEDWLPAGVVAPLSRLLSIRVLDADNAFPDEQLWARAVVDALNHAADRGCRVVNLSIGDRNGAMTDRRATRVAALVDRIARDRGLVVVVPTGNIEDPRIYMEPNAEAPGDYVRAAAESPETTLLDPGPAALALTVGGLGADGVLRLGERAIGDRASPSALTRRGPGVARAIKPELAAPAGTFALADLLGFVTRKQLQRIVLSHRPDELFARDKGTSFAAPLVTRVATAVQAQYPDFSAPLVRALVLQASRPVPLDGALLPEGTPTEQQRQRLNFVGHGTPSVESARFSRRDRVVFVAEGSLQVDRVVLFEVPIPNSFYEPGGTRSYDLSVCFDPLTRYRRKDYLASRLFPYLFMGHTAEEILAVLAEAELDELEEGEADTADDAPTAAPRKLRDLQRVPFKPSTAMSSDSANILMRGVRRARYDENLARVAHLAIRSTSRWAPDDTVDPFGIALAIGHDRPGIDLYAELRARVEVPVEIEIET